MAHLELYRRKLFIIPFLLVFLAVSSCQVTLAPAYDQAIFDGVTENSELAMQFFANVEGGTDNESFFRREPTYNKLIGAFESLKIQARSRPIPDNKAIARVNKMLRAKGDEAIDDSYPSAFAFERIAATFRQMKEFDEEDAMNPEVIATLKGQVEIYLDQAITYESFLKR
ncbi:hypothetical protein [Aequorivita marina]|uniref:hypothetical protein n=1 Tax=Aequorivita marina TaxID=3073654 RepID=UPI002876EFB1|nr:hypothetical protein [Aequorivita sp. S2608]MDS1298443.1 hypothetical protein [Aequorivita sp. S2608]